MGVRVLMQTGPWTHVELQEHQCQGSDQSCNEYMEFPPAKMHTSAEKGFWTALPYRLVKHLNNKLRVTTKADCRLLLLWHQ
jgi:hypothetical protein